MTIVSAYEQDISFVIGIAGTGKSTHLAKVADENCIVLTPTHKAKRVLEKKGVKNVFTIHSVLKLVPTLNTEMRRGQRLQRLQKLGETDLRHIGTVIIDEYSMISVDIMDMLLEALPSHANILVYGDAQQLPPVDGEPIEPETYTDDITVLKKQHRAEAPEVVETFTRAANYIIGIGRDIRLNPNIPHGTLATFNPKTDRALAFTNAKVIEMNTEIAKYCGLPKVISIGEEVVINDLVATLVDCPEHDVPTIYPKMVSKGRLLTGDDLQQAIAQTEHEIAKFKTDLSMYDVSHVSIEGDIYRVYTSLDHYTKKKELTDEVKEAQFSLIDTHKLQKDINLADWCKQNRGATGVKRRANAWKFHIAHSNLVWDLRRPFATTVHKSQGSEFDTVYIAIKDLQKAIRGKDFKMYARLLYVALSRATKGVVIVN